MKNKYKVLFWVAQALLLAAAAVLGLVLIGYNVMAFMLLGVAALLGIFRLLHAYGRKKPGRARVLKYTLTALIIAGALTIGALEIPIISAARSDENPAADYLVVLGAGINGTTPSWMLIFRLNAAKAYLDKYPNAKVVVSGGQGPDEDISEAECMRRWLEGESIAPERILMEDKSTSTLENLTYSLEIIRQDGGNAHGSIAIVSSEYHLYRAKYMAREMGVEPLGVAARTPYPFMRLNYYIREALAVLWMKVM